ncbi:acyltransferase family protein [Bacillus testis]|uniref:acyltransferase family protein n=1 Tax=Bacillus testis TaxID=1622072 RepID=UPI00067EDD46|nr:acyltransferase family protein [Bacillus testis]
MVKKKREHSRYIPGLDGLRAIAVLAVIAYHLNFKWASGGLLGVTIFFVLSGYLITNLLLIEWDRTQRIDLKNFWIRRARRLLPAMFTMLFAVTAWVTLFDQSFLAKLRDDFLPAVFYYSNWWYIFQDLSYFESMGTPSLLTHFWSLAVEEQFYIVWPLLIFGAFFFKLKKKQRLVITLTAAFASALAMAILYSPTVDPSRIYYGTDTRAFSLLIGAALAMVWPSHKLSRALPKKIRFSMDIIGGVALASILLMMVLSNEYNSFLYRGGMVLLSLLTAILIAVLVHPSSKLATYMSFKPLKWIGMRSYGIYLWHYPIILLTTQQVDTGSAHPLRMLAQMALTVAIAELSYRYIENPIRHGAIGRISKKVRSGQIQWKAVATSRWIALGCGLIAICISSIGLASTPENQDKDLASHKKTEAIVEQHNTQTANMQVGDHNSPPSQTKPSEGKQPEKNQVKHSLKMVSVIGDSVMIDAAPFLKEHFPNIIIDAKVGRQMHQAESIVEQMKRDGKLGDTIIIGLGSNGAFNSKQLSSLLDAIGKDKHIVLINARVPRPWESIVNDSLSSAASSHDNVSLVDWFDSSTGHNEYFANDGIHLTKTGAQAFALLISSEINS